MLRRSKTSTMIIVILAVVTFFTSDALADRKRQPYELSIVHFSDFHSRYVPISRSGGLCYPDRGVDCIAGISRASTMLKRLRVSRPDTIFLNAGDDFQGTLYFELYRGNVTADFMNELRLDAMTIGNHDFDDGIAGYASYARRLNAPVVVANIDSSYEPLMKDVYANSTIVERYGKRIGIIGVLFSDTDKISTKTGKLKFNDEVKSVNDEAKKLKAEGIDVIVVLSHCGVERDKIMARECPHVNVIVGGHSHVVLWSGKEKPPSGDIPYDNYPIVIKQPKTNRTVIIVHSGPYLKYIGDIRVKFDDNNEVTGWSGEPIYLDQRVTEDPVIVEKLKPWKIGVDKVGQVKVGVTKVFLNGTCYFGGCNFADFITDAMLDKYAEQNATISLITASNIMNSIPVGEIVKDDVYSTMPYNNTWDLIELDGTVLLQVIEDNVAKSSSNATFVNYLLIHWSGLRVTYDLAKKGSSRIVGVKIKRDNNDNSDYVDFNVNARYRVVVASYLLSRAFEKIRNNYRLVLADDSMDVDNLMGYVKKVNVVDTSTESRMIFV